MSNRLMQRHSTLVHDNRTFPLRKSEIKVGRGGRDTEKKNELKIKNIKVASTDLSLHYSFNSCLIFHLSFHLCPRKMQVMMFNASDALTQQ
jgi:hypothetical protein